MICKKWMLGTTAGGAAGQREILAHREDGPDMETTRGPPTHTLKNTELTGERIFRSERLRE